PERVIETAVRGMLPKTTLGRAQLRKLKVYAGPEHPHAAQKPQPFDITQVAQQGAGATTHSTGREDTQWPRPRSSPTSRARRPPTTPPRRPRPAAAARA